jgi:hypothetical protein
MYVMDLKMDWIEWAIVIFILDQDACKCIAILLSIHTKLGSPRMVSSQVV